MKLLIHVFNCSERPHQVTTMDVLTIASILYLISNIGWLFTHGVFWDDWTIYENPIGLEQMMTGNGGTWIIPFHVFCQNLSHQLSIDVVLLYRFTIFLLGWIDVLLYYHILKNFNLNNAFVSFTSIMFASWPLGYSHILMCCISYQIGILFQLIAIFLFVKVVNNSNVLLSFLIIVFQFFASMFLNSTIVFWFGFLVVMATFKTFKAFSFSFQYAVIWLHKMLKYSIYFIPCLVFWVMRTIYWMPTGEYAKENYNAITVHNIVKAPVNIIIAISKTISFIIYQFSFVFSLYIYLFVFFVVLFLLLWFFKNKNLSTGSLSFPFFISLLFLFLCSIAAYILVGKIPVFDHVDDRFGILLALVVSPIIVSLLLYLRTNVYKFVFIFVSIFCSYSLSQSIEGIRLSHRNDAIIEFFMKNELPPGNVVVAEECPKFRSNYYSWGGLYHKATGLQNRCFECTDMGVFYDSAEYLIEEYWQKDARPGAPTVMIYFVNENGSKSYIATFKRLFEFFIDKDVYKQMLLNDFDIRWESIKHN